MWSQESLRPPAWRQPPSWGHSKPSGCRSCRQSLQKLGLGDFPVGPLVLKPLHRKMPRGLGHGILCVGVRECGPRRDPRVPVVPSGIRPCSEAGPVRTTALSIQAEIAAAFPSNLKKSHPLSRHVPFEAGKDAILRQNAVAQGANPPTTCFVTRFLRVSSRIIPIPPAVLYDA